jgi:hypothetical protein
VAIYRECRLTIHSSRNRFAARLNQALGPMPQDLYCWRCDLVVPMLTEREWEVMEPVLHQAILDVQAYRSDHGVTLKEAVRHGHGESALRLYRDITGRSETNSDAIWHHRVSIYGPPCKGCSKPLRTPQASFCAACGARA